MHNFEKAILAACAAVALMGSSSVGQDLRSSSVESDLAYMPGFVESDYPLVPSLEGNQGKSGDFRAFAVSDGYDGFSGTFFYLYHPSGHALQYFAKSSDSLQYGTNGGFRLSVSLDGSLADYGHYSAEVTSWSSDKRFVKIFVKSGFGYSADSAKRVYQLASFEIMAEDGKASVAYALGTKFEVTGYGASKEVKVSDFTVLSVNPYAWAAALPGVNGHSGDYFFTDGAIIKSSEVHTTVYSLMFPVPKSLGTVVGIKMEWTPVYCYYQGDGKGNVTTTRHVDESRGSGVRKYVTFSDSDCLDVASFDDAAWGLHNLNVKLWASFFKSGQDAWVIPAVQKMAVQGAKGYYREGDNDQSHNPFVLDEGSNDAALKFASDYPESDLYCFHFDFRDTETDKSVPWWAFNMFGAIVYTAKTIIAALTGSDPLNATGWDMEDVSVLQLRMMKDGKAYILAVSGDSKYLSGNTPYNPKSSPDWWRVALFVLGIFGGFCVAAWFVDKVSSGKKGRYHGKRR